MEIDTVMWAFESSDDQEQEKHLTFSLLWAAYLSIFSLSFPPAQGEGHRDMMEEWKSMAVGFLVIGVDLSAGLVAVTPCTTPTPHSGRCHFGNSSAWLGSTPC